MLLVLVLPKLALAEPAADERAVRVRLGFGALGVSVKFADHVSESVAIGREADATVATGSLWAEYRLHPNAAAYATGTMITSANERFRPPAEHVRLSWWRGGGLGVAFSEPTTGVYLAAGIWVGVNHKYYNDTKLSYGFQFGAGLERHVGRRAFVGGSLQIFNLLYADYAYAFACGVVATVGVDLPMSRRGP